MASNVLYVFEKPNDDEIFKLPFRLAE